MKDLLWNAKGFVFSAEQEERVRRVFALIQDMESERYLPFARVEDVDWTEYRRAIWHACGAMPTSISFLRADDAARRDDRSFNPRPLFAGPTQARCKTWGWLRCQLETQTPVEMDDLCLNADVTLLKLPDVLCASVPQGDRAVQLVKTLTTNMQDCAVTLIVAAIFNDPVLQHIEELVPWMKRNPPVRWCRRGVLEVLVA